MYKLFYISIFTAIIICVTHAAFANGLQDSTKSDTLKTKSSFKLGVDYLSNNVFMGRTGPTNTPILSPNAKYTFGFGLYVSGSANYLPNNATNKLDGGDAVLGYDFDITDNLSGGISYTKMFYNTNSTQIGSSISNEFSANLDYDIGTVITPSINIDYDLNKQGITNDKFINFGLGHDIIFEKLFAAKDLILITPTIALNAGTQNFYDAYVTKKVFKNKKRTATQNALITKFEQNVNQFNLLDYEFSVPIEYKAGGFIFQFTPAYDIVENSFKPAVAKTLGLADKTSVFYFTTGVAWKF